MISLMDTPTYTLHKMELSRTEAREVLNCICHSILFIRGPNNIEPEDIKCDYFDVEYAKIKGNALDKIVYEAIDNFIAAMKKQDSEYQFTLSFYQPVTKSGWLGKEVIKRYWEHWDMPLVIIDPKTKSLKDRATDNARKLNQAQILKENILAINMIINDCLEKTYLPIFNKDYGLHYPFEIIADRNKTKSAFETFATSFKELVQKGPPQLIPRA